MKRLILALFGTVAFAQTPPNAAIKSAEIQFVDQNGAPLAGGYLYTCVAGRSCRPMFGPGSPPTNPQATYTDSTAGTPNANPVVLDGYGRAQVWMGPQAYLFYLTDISGKAQWRHDNVEDTTLYFTNSVKTVGNCTLVSFNPSATGSVTHTCPPMPGDFVSLRDFGATGNGSTDDTAAVQAAVSAQPYQKIICPAGTYKMTSTVRWATGVQILGVGPGSCILSWDRNGMDGITPASNMVIDNVTLQGGWTSESTNGCGSGGGCAINGGVGINNVTIRYSTVTGWAGHGINTGGGCGYIVTGNTIQNTRDDGILLVGLCGANQTASAGIGSTVTGNLFSNIGSNSVDMNSSNNEIGWNRIVGSGFQQTGTDFYAILCAAGTIGSLGVINCDENNIHDNTIIGTRGPAIDIRAETGTANRNHVTHNIGEAVGSDMPAITTLVQVDSSVGAGCTGTVDSTLVIGNTANGFANGLVQGGGTFCTITNTLFANNIVTNSRQYGIIVAFGTAVKIGNTIHGSGTADLY